MDKVTCPYCGYKMPIHKTPEAVCRGLWVKCKGRGCGREFEVVLPRQADKKPVK